MDSCRIRFIAPAVVLGAVACGPSFTHAQYVDNYGAGFVALMDAAEAADSAHQLISDTSITELRDDGPARQQTVRLVNMARDKYRKARSYTLPCEPNQYASISDATHGQASGGSWAFRPAGRSISVLARAGQQSNGIGYRIDYLISARGRTILGASCKRDLPAKCAADSPSWSPDDRDPSGCPVTPEYRPLLMGDGVNIDDIIVNIKR